MTQEERDSLYEQLPELPIYYQQYLLGIAFKVLQNLEQRGSDTGSFFSEAELFVDKKMEGALDK